eukprot:5296830-Amphidinium_carterae.1
MRAAGVERDTERTQPRMYLQHATEGTYMMQTSSKPPEVMLDGRHPTWQCRRENKHWSAQNS